MPSAFAELWAAAQPLVDDQWGEPVRLLPKAAAGGSKFVVRDSDYTGIPRDLVGVFRDNAVTEAVKGSGANTHENVDVLTRRTSIDFDQTLFDDERPIPAEGWIVIATSQPKQPRYSISTVEPDGIARVVCKVVFLDYAA